MLCAHFFARKLNMRNPTPPPKKALIFAHFDKVGGLREDSLKFLTHCARKGYRTILVSTNLNDESIGRLPSDVEVITRENVGYDFFSYRTGIFRLMGVSEARLGQVDPEEWNSLVSTTGIDKLILVNSSFLIADPSRLTNIIDAEQTANISGITISGEVSTHIQSYFLSFQAQTVASACFIEWWRKMIPISERERVIQEYEIGLTTWFLDHGKTIGSAFSPSFLDRTRAALSTRQRAKPFSASPIIRWRAINPTMFFWYALWRKYSIVKIELFERNPHSFNLSILFKDPLFREPT